MNSLIMLFMLEHAGFWFSFRFDHFDLHECLLQLVVHAIVC